MRAIAIIGLADKGVFNTPSKIDNVKDLHTTFGKKSNLVSTAEQLIYEDHKPILVRVEDDSSTASAYLLDDDDTICMTIHADSPGLTGHATTVEIARGDNTFNILVFNNGEMVEFWGNLKLDQVDEIVNFASKWITVSVLKETLPVAGIINLSGEIKQKEVYEENILKALKTINSLDVEFLLMPECDSLNVINEVIDYLEEEKPNTILLLDGPVGNDLIETYKWCKKLTPSDNTAVFWPWLNYERRSIPASGSVMTAILKWPQPWRATRVKLAGISDSSFDIHHDELAYLSKQEHAINVLGKKKDHLFLDANIRTLAGNKLSERILLNHIRSKISKIGTELLMVHNPVSYNFRNNFLESCEYILEQIKEDQGINNYNILVNELAQTKVFEVNVAVGIRDSAEIVNICFKFIK